MTWFRPRTESTEGPLRDIRYYRNLTHYPRHEQYQNLAKEFFELPPTAAMMSAVINQLKSQGFVQEKKELLRRPDRLIWRHRFTCHFDQNRLQITGEGFSPTASYTAAFMGFMYQLHVFGWLRRLFEQDEIREAVDRQKRLFAWSPEDIDAKMHIHNFAARYMVTPEVVVAEHLDNLFEAVVMIPQTNWIARVTAEEARKAEFLAYAALKDQIEQDFLLQGQQIDLKDNSHVNLDNCREILSLYKNKQAFGHFQKLDENVPGPEEATWKSLRLFWDHRPLSRFHEMPTRKEADVLAALEAAVRLVKEHPILLQEYHEITKDSRGFMPKRISPKFASLNPDVVFTLAECVDAAKDTDLDAFQLEKHEPGYKPSVIKRRKGLDLGGSANAYRSVAQSLAARSDELRQQHELDMDKPHMKDIMAARARLPIYQHKAQILAMVKNHDQCIVVGSTGSGKSTQVPQLILDDAIAEGRGALCNVFCTQPRRISSVALALTVCNERDRDLGDVVGYRIGGDYYNFSKKGGSITYCTTELLANELERAEEELPHDVSHIIIDEIHERSADLDRLLSVVKLTFSKRLALGLKVPKLVLMSATVESDLFERYFEMVSQDGTIIRPPYLNVPGRVYETTTKFLDQFEDQLSPEIYQAVDRTGEQKSFPSRLDGGLPPAIAKPKQAIQWESAKHAITQRLVWQDSINAVAATIVHIVESTEHGAILAFVPGAHEIRLVHQALLKQKRIDLGDASKFEILMLHRYNPADLAKALDESPKAVRRIMISTNIAETSITFPNVEFVVDSGLQRSTAISHIAPVELLEDHRISRASVLQRAGRAGRTRPGHYYGAFSQETMQNLDIFPNSYVFNNERVQKIYLRAKVHFPSVPIQEVFDSYLQPIPTEMVQSAENRLRAMGGLTQDNEVSMIGYSLYRTTLEPAMARMVLLGLLFKCVDRAILLAVLLSTKVSIFDEVNFNNASPTARRATAERFSEGTRSDLLSQMRAFEEYRLLATNDAAGAREWATQNCISHNHFEQVQLRVEAVKRNLYKVGFFKHRQAMHFYNQASNNVILLKMLICAGLYPNVAAHQKHDLFVTYQALAVRPSPSSIAWSGDYTKPETRQQTQQELVGSICCYRRLLSAKSGTGKPFMGDLTHISPLMLALFAQNVKSDPKHHNQLLIDDSIPLKFSGDTEAATTFLDFKRTWDVALLSELQRIAQMWSKDSRKMFTRGVTDIIIGAVQELLEYEDGQAKRREGDVGSFMLSDERTERLADINASLKTRDDLNAAVPDQTGFVPNDMPICSICGQDHLAKYCPDKTIDPGSPKDQSFGQRPLTAWDPSAEEDTAAAWTPTGSESDDSASDDELAEFPSELDHR